jgi:hypothetical protein
MENPEEQNLDPETATISRLIDVRLRCRWQDESAAAAPAEHPDDDAITAFVEGRLGEADAAPIVSHLVGCAACLHLTAQLIRGAEQMDEVSSASMPEAEPGPLRRLFDRMAAGLIPSVNEDAVFAYHETGELTEAEPPKAEKDTPEESSD